MFGSGDGRGGINVKIPLCAPAVWFCAPNNKDNIMIRMTHEDMTHRPYTTTTTKPHDARLTGAYPYNIRISLYFIVIKRRVRYYALPAGHRRSV